MRLGVNIDHIATIRQARGTIYPDPLDAAIYCARAGAHNITAHLREDRRHIQDDDIYRLKSLQPLPLNLEMANIEGIIDIALDVCPSEACIVPEQRHELTTEGGLDVINNYNSLKKTISILKEKEISVSLFVEPDEKTLIASKDIGVSIVELHTGAYCDANPNHKPALLEKLIEGAEIANQLGMQVNAGHGITMDNMSGILCIPHLDTLNIGHSIISRAVFLGMENAVKEVLDAIKEYNN